MNPEPRRNMSHKDYFKFLNRINEILSEYDVSELESFYRISRQSFPHMASILKDLVLLARRGSRGSPRKLGQGATATGSKDRFGALDLLNSKTVFPSNQDLADYAMTTLGIRLRWEHDARGVLARKILRVMRSLPPNDRLRAIEELRNMAMRRGVPVSFLDESGFFESWERVIKEQTNPND